MSRTIAIVEDDSDQRENYADALESQGYVVQTYANKAQALEGFSSSLPDLAILDIMLEDEIEGHSFHFHRMPLNQMTGFHLSLPQLIDIQALTTPTPGIEAVHGPIICAGQFNA